MTLRNVTLAHAVVMVATLGCLTVLGVFDKIEGNGLVAIFSGIAGVVFGAAASQSASNGTAQTVVDAAIERGALIDTGARGRSGRRSSRG